MAKDLVTGVVQTHEALEWVSYRISSGRAAALEKGAISLVAEEPDGEGVNIALDQPAAGPVPASPEDVASGLAGLMGDVAVALSTDKVLLKIMDLPAADPEELQGMVELQVDKFAPFAVENMVVSFEVLDSSEDMVRVLIAAVKKDIVNSLGEMFNLAGILPVNVDVTSMGWWHLLCSGGKISTDGRQIVLIMDGVAPSLMVVQDGALIAVRSIGDIVCLSGQELAGEIARETAYTLMSIEREFPGSVISGVSLWWQGDVPHGLAEMLKEEYTCSVEAHDLSELPALSDGIVGRAILARTKNDMLCLIPSEWSQLEKARIFKKKLLTAVSLVFGLWLLIVGGFFGFFWYQSRTLESLRAERDAWKVPAEEAKQIRRRVRTLELYTDDTFSALKCLHNICQALPSGVEFRTYDYKKEERVIKIDGIADTDDLRLAFVKSLNELKYFSNVKQGPTVLERATGKIKYSIDLELPEVEE